MSPLRSTNWAFSLVLEGPDPTTGVNLDRLYEAGCDDATFGVRDGVFVAEFDRASPSLVQALSDAIATVEATVPGLHVVRVEPEELVTAAEIAVRTKRSRENVRQLFEGLRGRGDFPRPTVWLSDRTRLWHWAEVSRWFSAHTDEEVGRDGDASVFVVTNALLTLRRFLTSRHGSQSAAADRASLVSAWSELGSWVLESTPPRGRGNAGASSLRRFLKNFG